MVGAGRARWLRLPRFGCLASCTRFKLLLYLTFAVILAGNAAFFLSLASLDSQRHHDGGLSGAGHHGRELDDGAAAAKPPPPPPPVVPPISISVLSSRLAMTVSVSGTEVYRAEHAEGVEDDRGLHVVVLGETDGSVKAKRVFDTYLRGSEHELVGFLESVNEGRIVVLGVRDEASFHLKEAGRLALLKLGSKRAGELGWRDTWAMICKNQDSSFQPVERLGKSKSLSEWGAPVQVSGNVPVARGASAGCDWPRTVHHDLRKRFCAKYEGFKDICRCKNPVVFPGATAHATRGLEGVPVAIIACDARAKYLSRTLHGLLATNGIEPEMVTVFIDGYATEALHLTQLYGVKAVQQTPKGEKAGRVSHHYKDALSGVFNLYPKAEFAIVLEEDLDVAPDFFEYFAHTKPLLAADASLYCVSAWNDQGYKHTTQDPGLLYRVETMPGLGWMLSRKLYKRELEAQWPADKQWDWDMWMRMDAVRKKRECVIPDIPRTFHFGAKGVSMNSFFHDVYFSKHRLAEGTGASFVGLERLSKVGYNEELEQLIAEAVALDHTTDPCAPDLVPRHSGRHHVLYIKMRHPRDWDTWLALAKCWHIWDLDARGFHESVWRLFLNETPLLVVGTTSKFAHHKPGTVEAVFRPKKPKKPSS